MKSNTLKIAYAIVRQLANKIGYNHVTATATQ